MAAVSPRKRHAVELFAPLGPTYNRYASLLSLGQDPRWRRFLVSRVDVGPGNRVLDVATGTAAVAIELVKTKRCSVVGLDQSPEMLSEGRSRVERAGLAGAIGPEGVGPVHRHGRGDAIPDPDQPGVTPGYGGLDPPGLEPLLP